MSTVAEPPPGCAHPTAGAWTTDASQLANDGSILAEGSPRRAASGL